MVARGGPAAGYDPPVASHFECLGFPLRPEDADGERIAEILRGVFEGGRPVPAPEGFHAASWESPEGIAAFAAVESGGEEGGLALRCLSPSFAGTTRAAARVFRTLPDPACPFCDFLHGEVRRPGADSGEPFFAEVRDGAFARGSDLRGAGVVVQLGLLAQHARAFRDREEFRAKRPEGAAAGSFVATGLLAPPHRPRARVAGSVAAPRLLRNPLGGGEFWHARLAADAVEVDALIAAADLPGGLAEGAVLLAEGSLLVRFPDGLPG